MNRKQFMKNTTLLAAAGLLAPYACSDKSSPARTNWGGAYTYQAKDLLEPSDMTDLLSMVRKSEHQKVLGSRHCFNAIADSPVNQISLRRLNKMVNIGPRSVTIQGGMRYDELAPMLDAQGFALHNLASLPGITVAGACATATHGSGSSNGNLSTAVSAIEFISGEGEVIHLSRDVDGDVFQGAVVNLGALGILTELTLDVQSTFNVRQNLFQNMPLYAVKEHFEEIMSSGYSVSLFTDWQRNNISEVWIKRRTDQPATELGKDFYGATAAIQNLHPVERFSPEACTEQLGVEGKWYDRLPHFKINALPPQGSEVQSEYFVPMKNAVEAILALNKKGDIIFPQLLISEVRTIAADNLWMSPAYHEPKVGLHFTWKQNWDEIKKILPVIEAELIPLGAVPHWGKTFTMDPKIIQSRYPKLNEFIALTKQYDPKGKFRNEFLDTNIFNG